jgi:hypothetical protein
MKEKNGIILVGSNQRLLESDAEKVCEICGSPCFFTDNWNFKKADHIICWNCGHDRIKNSKDEVMIHEQSIQNFSKITGQKDWETSLRLRQIIEEDFNRTPKVINDKQIQREKKWV